MYENNEDNVLLWTIGLLALLLMVVFGGCVYDKYRRHVNGNQKVFDVAWNYRYADVYLPNGEMKTIEIDTWNDYEGEQLQINGRDGVNYIVSSFNTILRSK